jgi:spore coat protein U-like protein
MKLLKWRYSLFLMPVALWLSVNSAHADITCTASMNNGTVNISNTITPANANNAQITATLNYSCTNNVASDRYASLCLGVDGGDFDSATLNPRYMTGLNGSKLAFTMTRPDGSLWGNTIDSTYKPATFLIAPNATVSASAVITVSLLPNLGNTLATQGLHSSDFGGNHTTLTYQSDIVAPTSYDCNSGIQTPSQFPFKVQATVVNDCKINTTSNVILGSRPASTTSFTGSNNRAIDMTCTNGVLYKIGLAPSNGDINGAGMMSSTTDTTLKLPYQLQSNASGTGWGNNGSTYATLTNGVTGQGNGATQLQTVYVTVPNSDVKPASYSDTVTVHVNY